MTRAPYPQRPSSEEVNTIKYDFSENAWVPDAVVAMCNVPWDSSYRDIVRFATETAKNSYFNTLRNSGDSLRIERLTILKYGEPIILSVPFTVANQYNYLIVDGDSYSGQSGRYYYFIEYVEYVAPNTTKVWVQLDVWQTYYNQVTFNRCFVERGHIAIANANSTHDNLAEYLSIPEGLDFGNEYLVTQQVFWNFMETKPYVVVVSTTDLAADYGTVDNPSLKSASGGVYDHIPNGCNVYAFSGPKFEDLMIKLSDYPWVAQGIIMITMVPRKMLTLGDSISVNGITGYRLAGVSSDDAEQFVIDNFFGKFKIPSRYASLKKFYTFPYSFVQMTTLSGGEVVLKPECVTDFKYGTNYGVEFRLITVVSPPHIRALIYPARYNSNGGTQLYIENKNVKDENNNANIPDGDGLDIAVQLGNFPQLTLVNNNYIQYLASTAHTRNYLFEQADWSFSKAQAGASLAYDQASKAIDVRQQDTNLSIGAMRDRETINQLTAIGNGTGNAIGAIAGQNPGGIISSVVSAGVSVAATGANTAVNTALAAGQTANVNSGARFQRDTNLDYATFANRGDYQNAVHQIQAKVQDARLTQPSTVGQNGGEVFNWSNGMLGVLFKFKRIKDQFITTIGEYWFRYGYYVNNFIVPPPTLACCSKFTYWKMQETYLSAGTTPEVYKDTIRGIFQKGVTVWVNPAHIGVTDPATNLPLEGVEY